MPEWWKAIFPRSEKAGWRRRMSLMRATKGTRLPGWEKSRCLISYFSDSKYSSLASDIGWFSHSS